jgi:hypothetical protein
MAGSMEGLVKVRLTADGANVETVADLVVDALESEGYTVVEWTKPYPCREEEDKSRVYITALVKKEEDFQKE